MLHKYVCLFLCLHIIYILSIKEPVGIHYRIERLRDFQTIATSFQLSQKKILLVSGAWGGGLKEPWLGSATITTTTTKTITRKLITKECLFRLHHAFLAGMRGLWSPDCLDTGSSQIKGLGNLASASVSISYKANLVVSK